MWHVVPYVLITAHPRVSGENTRAVVVTGPRTGSSPRERGKPLAEIEARYELRLIPA